DQTHDSLPEKSTVFEAYHDVYPRLTETEVRTDLGGFLFTGDDVFKPVGKLSGGEKSRLKLAILMHSSSNFLILDEPTNHLDFAGKETLEDALKAYPGTLITVSHDRYFINTVSDRILELYRNTFLDYPGNYDYYLEKKDEFHRLYDESHPVEETITDASEEKEKRRKRKEAETLSRRKENEIRSLEETMNRLEEEIASIDKALSSPENATDAETLMDLTAKKEKKEALLNEAFTEWESKIES
ncbi:MAG: ABC-F family ATP-binding cassette domain-containing protein, partial [Lachnospiraceae bacterium]|nr:ABC-F family ATP-binding cassette domain-containing protein [Lachnospiraceae bacterium]